MPPSSLVKFSNRQKSGGRSLFWGRSDVDGLPFRGTNPPSYTEEEFEERTVRVRDFRNSFFDISNPEDNKTFCDVMDCIANGWFQLVHIDRFWKGSTKHYVEWLEFYLEDGSRTPFVSPAIMELANGQQNLNGHS